jgi:hypothetical protein
MLTAQVIRMRETAIGLLVLSAIALIAIMSFAVQASTSRHATIRSRPARQSADLSVDVIRNAPGASASLGAYCPDFLEPEGPPRTNLWILDMPGRPIYPRAVSKCR